MSGIPDEVYVLNGRYDTRAMRNGAVQYIKCPSCGSDPGMPCSANSYQPLRGQTLLSFAHAARRWEYHNWMDIYGPATQSWEFVIPTKTGGAHQFSEPEKMPPCSHPRRHCAQCAQCECGAMLADHASLPAPEKKFSSSNSYVDDLLG